MFAIVEPIYYVLGKRVKFLDSWDVVASWGLILPFSTY